MTGESASDRQQQWALVVRRSFGIPDLVDDGDARETLIGSLEQQLREKGWQNPTRAICEPIVDALIVFGPGEDLSDRDAANRLLNKGITVVDPQQLVFDARFEYPPEIVAVAQQTLDRVGQYAREQPFGD